MIYLDTHVVIWLYAGDPRRLTPAACAAIEAEADCRISPVVELELGYMREVRRLSHAPDTIISELERTIGLVRCPEPLAAIVGAALPLTWTRDPFDRLITAHAALTGSTLITPDTTIRAHYPTALW
jgi:PIN domain nuclease of toxin-antitoxin system